MKTIFGAAFVVVMLAVGLVPVLAGDGGTQEDPGPVPESSSSSDTAVPEGIDGPPLVVNGETLSPDLICAGVDGAVVFVDDETRYIAGFEDGLFLRVMVGEEVMETSEVTLESDASGAYAIGILHGEFDEFAVTMYLDDGLADCPELSEGEDAEEEETSTETTVPQTTVPEPSPAEPVTTTTEAPSAEAGIDGPPLVVNGEAITPDSICPGVDGAVVFAEGGTLYIAGFEGGPFLRVVLSDGHVLETTDVTLSEDPSGAYSRGILRAAFPEAEVTMYLDEKLPECSPSSPPPSSVIVNGEAVSPDLVCAGVDGAVVFVDDDDGIRYIAGFESGPFLRVILSDGEVLETFDVTLSEDTSGEYTRGVLHGEFPEANITLYLAGGLADCPELG